MKHKITALTIQKRNHKRVNVYLDDEFAFGLARIAAAWLQVGQEISDEKIAELRTTDEHEVAYQRALNFLSYRPRTEFEICRNLRKHDVTDETIEHVVERLKRNGLLNDASFAQVWIENRSEMRPRSRRALAYELRQHGVNPKTTEQALEEVDDEEMAYQAAKKRVRRFKDLEWQDFRQKMYRYLAQRGFNYQVSAPVVARIWAETHSPGEETWP